MSMETVKIAFNLNDTEFEYAKNEARKENRSLTSYLRNRTLKLASEKVVVEEPPKPKENNHGLPVGFKPEEAGILDDYKQETGMTAHKALRLMLNQEMKQNFTLQTLNNEASTDDITEHLIQ